MPHFTTYTLEEFEILQDMFKSKELDCYPLECGSPPSNIIRKQKFSGIDRLDNQLGYVVGNVVPCCKFCNIAKSTMTVDEFKNHVNKIYNKWITG